MMSKQESLIIKGIAILMMIYLHASVSDFLNLTEACNPVPFFLLVSGYGFSRSRRGLFQQLLKCFNILLYYWLILSIFLLLGYYLKPTLYFNDVKELIWNYTTWKTTYNGECWFLFPYLILSVTSRLIIKVIHAINPWKSLCILVLFYLGTLYALSRWGMSFIYDNQFVLHALRYIQFLLPFGIGVIVHKYSLFERFKKAFHTQFLIIASLILLILIRCQINVNYFDSIYAIIFCILFLSIKRFDIIDRCLAYFGKHSMNMWFIHSWFCFYLFRSFFYSVSNPFLVYLLLVLASLLLSILINATIAIIRFKILDRGHKNIIL